MYLKWQEQTIGDFSAAALSNLYAEGWLFSRAGKGAMYQTRSLRINLAQFELSSENRRILRKTENLALDLCPLPYAEYHWSIGKLGKDFYTSKFGEGTFSANKIKELFTDPAKNNFNRLLVYRLGGKPVGYCVALETDTLLHYSYPFYDLAIDLPNLGLGMMLQTILEAQKRGKQYVYLGSATRPSDTYKLQFGGLEWFNGTKWNTDQEELKKILSLSRQN